MSYLFETDVEIGDGRHRGNAPPKLECRDVDFWYGEKHALKGVNLDIYDKEVTAFIGPSGCGKSTLLKCLNRANDIIPEARMTGTILMDGADLHDPGVDPVEIRKRFGWVAQKPNPFPSSIFANVAYGPRLHGQAEGRAATRELVQGALEAVGLWDEVKDRLGEPGTALSGGQQQRLCIARAIAYRPDVILMDEPCSALDPAATARVEQLIEELKQNFAIVLITHNLSQAARVAQRTSMFHLGELVEVGDTEQMFLNPADDRTKAFITGRYG